MGAIRATLILLCLTVVLEAVLSVDCPSQCRCTTSEYTHVDCSNAGLTSIPKFPIDTTVLDLSGNSLTTLPDSAFTSTPILRSLDLSHNELNRIELNAFENLGDLQMLNLSHNYLDGNDFKNLEMMRGARMIKELDLSHNSFTEIPNTGFTLLTNLEKLHMSDNSMTDPTFGPSFVYLEVLEYVDLSGNNFVEIPSHTFNILKYIKTINISRCGIRRIKHDVFDQISTVAHFDISDNAGINQQDLNATIKAVCLSPHIASLRLSNVNLTDLSYVLTPLLDAENMVSLDLSNNMLARLNAADLRPARKLRYLNLSNNRLVEIPSLSLPYLKTLDVSNNSLSNILVQSFDGATDLTEVDLSHNSITEFDSEPFSRNRVLERLDMSFNNIWTVKPIVALENLKELSLRGNQIVDPTNLFMMYSLTLLDLGLNKIGALTDAMISERIDLSTLNLTHNQINHIDTKTFSVWTPRVVDLSYNNLPRMDSWGLTLVETLYLQGNNIDYISEQGLQPLGYLTELNLSGNRLTTLPNSLFDHLDDIKTLDLSNNNLGNFIGGPMGASLFSHQSELRSLSLKSNNLNSISPNYFSNLTVLEYLDLSGNNLAVITEGQLNDLSILKHLNISNNKLTGFNASTVSSLVSLISLDMSGTQWTCDCSIADIKKWMETTQVEVVNYNLYKCVKPTAKEGVTVRDYNIAEANCAETVMEKTIILIIIGCTSFVILVVAAIIFWQHRWRLKKKLKKQHYRAMYERQQTQVPNGINGTPMSHTDYHQHTHPHRHHHSSHNHTPNLPPKSMCTDHHQSSQAFV